MKRRSVARWLAAGLMLSVLSAHAAAGLNAATADELLRSSGLSSALAKVGPALQAALQRNEKLKEKIPAPQMEILSKSLAGVFESDRLINDARRQLIESMPPDTAASALAWLKSDIGRHVTALEDASEATENPDDRLKAASEIFKTLPARRIERYQALVKATNISEGSASIAIDLTLALSAGVTSLQAPEQADRLVAIKAELEKRRPGLVDANDKKFTVLFASTYASLDDRELDAYLAFLATPAGSAYQNATIKLLDTVLTDASFEAGQQVLRQIREAAPAAGA